MAPRTDMQTRTQTQTNITTVRTLAEAIEAYKNNPGRRGTHTYRFGIGDGTAHGTHWNSARFTDLGHLLTYLYRYRTTRQAMTRNRIVVASRPGVRGVH